jgi:2-keto-4-pentenoate hydratase/2-oxohepta-3-ene-1,7-dioic acid hydratase in catechol pathway
MKLLRYGPKGGCRPGIVDDDGQYRDLSTVIDDIGPDLLANDFAALAGIEIHDLPRLDPGVRIGPPLASVGKFVCIGLNYLDHARESGMATPAEPVIFLKASSSICGPFDDVVLPINSGKVDWEVELGVVVGREARYVSRDAAIAHIAGVCVVNDLSERAFQFERGGQWVKGKSCDTFGPLGPYVVTLDEIPDLSNLDLWCDVNGRRMQAGNTKNMIFDVPYLIHYVSQFMSLQPGDVISTGTPAGVALGRHPPLWLQEGDVVSPGITGLGEQRQEVVAYDAGANR